MGDFAAAAMMRLIALGLARQGLTEWEASRSGPTRPPVGAHVPLVDKRRLLAGLLHRHGPLALLRIGEGVDGAPDEPALVALSLARDPADLLSRWQRLERFVHSRHRSRVEKVGPGLLVVRHLALKPHPPPLLAEDLLVFGLLLRLMERSGARDLRARPAGLPGWWREAGRWALPPGGAAGAACWEIRWRGLAPPDAPPLAPGRKPAAAARRLLDADPGRDWHLPDLARALGLSARTLQRRLRAQGSSFSRLLVEARVAAAAAALGSTARSAAEIGYACGFADQAHFSRHFRRHAGMPPGVFRDAFHAGQPG